MDKPLDPPKKKRHLRPNESRATVNRPKVKKLLPVGKLAALKVPQKGDPQLESKFRRRKVVLIDRKRFMNPSKDPMDQFQGTLKIF